MSDLSDVVAVSIVFASRQWLWVAVALGGGALAVLVWGYARARGASGVRALGFALKALGIAALALCLVEPLWSTNKPRAGANAFVVAVDTSRSLQLRDRGATGTRAESVRASLKEADRSWLAALKEDFQVRRYTVDARLDPVENFEAVKFDGTSSSLATALRSLGDRYKGQPLAGILLFTDGIATDLPEGDPDLAGLPPVYPVVAGRDEPPQDVAIKSVAMNQTAFEDAPVTVQADFLAAGYPGGKLDVTLQKADGAQVEKQTLKIGGENETVSARFQVKPEKPGVSFYRLQVAPHTGEATTSNNSRLVMVNRGKGPYRVLFMGGRPGWEHKFMQRAVSDDDQVQMVSIVRIAAREQKFDWRQKPRGSSANPLFQAFDNSDTERFDQPVLVRLNTRDQAELRGGFPKTPEELFAYHAIVFDEIEAGFFTHEQLRLVQRFVSERGGAFLMLGGRESFANGKYERTPIADVLPVYLDRRNPTDELTGLQLNLTREGWLQPWARLRSQEVDERDRLHQMPALDVLNHVPDVKPGASVIATVADTRGKQWPALIVQRFGNGRSAALAVGDLWRWGMQDEANRRDMDKAWRQLMRWLVTDVPNRVELLLERKAGVAGQTVALQVRVRDPKFQPVDDATVTLKISPPKGDTLTIAAEPASGEAGLYETTFVPRESGAYLVEATAVDAVSGNGEVLTAGNGWTTEFDAEEFKSVVPDRRLLESIARKTGGEVIAIDKLDDFVRSLPNRKVPITETWTMPLWHTPAVFLFALACFVGEWGLRRWKGMA